MDSVIRGNPITREAHFLLDGVLTDPAVPRVTIRDPLGVAVVTDATPSRIATGIYQYVYGVPLNGPTGIYATEWYGTIAGQDLMNLSDPFQVLPVGAIAPVASSSYTYDVGTPVGQVRMFIDDRDLSSVSLTLPLEQRSCIFADEEIQVFLDSAGSEVLRAASRACLAIAGNKQLLVQARKVGKADLDFGQVRKDYLALADALIAQANAQPADGYVEQVWDDFSLRRLITNTQLRQNSG